MDVEEAERVEKRDWLQLREGGSLSGSVILNYTFRMKAMPYACTALSICKRQSINEKTSIPYNHSKPLIWTEVTDPNTAPGPGHYFGNFTACTKEKKIQGRKRILFNSQHN